MEYTEYGCTGGAGMRQADTAAWSGILVYLECRRGKLHPVGRELIAEAARLSAKLGGKVYAAALGCGLEDVPKQLADCVLDKIYLYETEEEYSPVLYEKIMTECIYDIKPSVVLIGGTYEGRALAPRLAVAFESGLTADCTALDIDEEDNLVQIRPAFGGNVMASIMTQFTRPQFATVRPGIMEASFAENPGRAEIVRKTVLPADDSFRILDVQEKEASGGITDARVLVVAGRGVKKKEDLAMLRELAGLLGGQLASSRALVEKGWMPPERQIGLSGSTVSPDYMITCGVSGTVQFMAGMRHTKNIIAVNTDPDARIFEIAHYPVCGDLYEIVPELIKRLGAGKGDGSPEIHL